ncbi:MAG: hypothetical protein QME58_02950 [Bacteroidota bacterium]|nr:hypothetical protein [Bacteroidota bacterium]
MNIMIFITVSLLFFNSTIVAQSTLNIGGELGGYIKEPTFTRIPDATILFGFLIETQASDRISLRCELQYKQVSGEIQTSDNSENYSFILKKSNYNSYQIELPLLFKLTSSPSSVVTYFVSGLSLIFKHETSVEGIRLVFNSGYKIICGGGLELNKGSTFSPFFETRYTMDMVGNFELSRIWNIQLLAGIKFLIL